jgi:hypothetical protein
MSTEPLGFTESYRIFRFEKLDYGLEQDTSVNSDHRSVMYHTHQAQVPDNDEDLG